jgi:hypothetical protein
MAYRMLSTAHIPPPSAAEEHRAGIILYYGYSIFTFIAEAPIGWLESCTIIICDVTERVKTSKLIDTKIENARKILLSFSRDFFQN